MAAVFDKPNLRQRVAPLLQGFDGPLAFAELSGTPPGGSAKRAVAARRGRC